jgi:hypothetical protein
MARHGLQMFWHCAAWAAPSAAAGAGPWWLIRVAYAWLATTRQLYRMLHAVGDETLARVYIVQDFIMPSASAAATLIERHTAAPEVDIWPLWLCPVRAVEPRHAADAGFGFPVGAGSSGVGDIWMNVGVYGQPAGGAPFDPVALNRRLEAAVAAGRGRKMLYAQNFDSPSSFWAQFDRAAYTRVRAAYAGGDAVFPDVARKALLGEARLQRMAGVKPATLLSAARKLALWFAGLLVELLLPRALHAPRGVEHTGLTVYARVAGGGPRPRHADVPRKGAHAAAADAATASATMTTTTTTTARRRASSAPRRRSGSSGAASRVRA